LVLVTCGVSCALLLLNRVLVVSLYAAAVPPALDFPRFRVIIQFLAIIGFLLPEWWLIDLLVRQLRNLYKAADAFREHP
jgi:hypothetical protein